MLRSSLLVAALVSALSDAQAQAATGRYRAPAAQAAPTRRGTEVRPQAAAPAASPAPSPFGAPAPHVVALKLVPAVIMSDGSVFADFGFGLEQVRRACGGVGGLGDTRSLSSGATIPTQSSPGMQRAPAQRTQSQQNLTSQPSQRQPSRAALGSCFTRDASGRVFVTQ